MDYRNACRPKGVGAQNTKERVGHVLKYEDSARTNQRRQRTQNGNRIGNKLDNQATDSGTKGLCL